MALRYVFNPFSSVVEPINEPLLEEEFFEVDAALEALKSLDVASIVKEKSERILVNGIELSEGALRDYILTNKTIVFNDGVLKEGDSIKINYLRRY